MARHARERQGVERSRRDGTGRAVVGTPFAIAKEVVAIPARWLGEAAQVCLFELPGMEHALATGGTWQQRQEFGANFRRSRFEVFDLGDEALVEIRRRGQPREKQERRLLARIREHRLLQVQMNANRLFHAPQGSAAVLTRERFHELREPGEAPLPHELLRMIHCALQSRGGCRRVEPATFRLRIAERTSVRQDRAHRVPALLVELREMQTRGMQLGLARECRRVRRGGGVELECRSVGARR